METELDFEQMFADLVEAETPHAAPGESFTIGEFADRAGIDRQKATRRLNARVKAGALESGKFTTDGYSRWHYWFTEAVQ